MAEPAMIVAALTPCSNVQTSAASPTMDPRDKPEGDVERKSVVVARLAVVGDGGHLHGRSQGDDLLDLGAGEGLHDRHDEGVRLDRRAAGGAGLFLDLDQ